MKISVSSSLLACTLISFAATGCESNSQFSPKGQQQAQGAAAALAAVQNPAGCLDVSKLTQKAAKSKQMRTMIVDINLDGKPSNSLLASVADSINETSDPNSDVSNKANQEGPQQDGCSTVTDKNSDGSVSVSKIVSSSPKILKTHTDASVSGSSETPPMDITYELVSAHRVRTTVEIPAQFPHDCNGKQTTESINETMVMITDFGDKLPTQPVESAGLKDLKKTADEEKAKVKNNDYSPLEDEYCASQN